MNRARCTVPPSGEAARAAASYRDALPVLETERLRLRPPHMGDHAAYEALMVGDQGHMGGPFTREDAWADFTNYVAGWLLHGHGSWAVERKADGALVGFVLVGLEWGDAEPEVGWMLLEAFRGQGYATEAAAAARDFGLRLYGPGGLVSYIDPTNPASERVAERLGAVRDRDAEALFDEPVRVWRHGGAV